jgi:hypothetical protein
MYNTSPYNPVALFSGVFRLAIRTDVHQIIRRVVLFFGLRHII